MKTRLACFAYSVCVSAAAVAVDPLPAVLTVAGYSGPDRTQRLIAGAKKEGELMIYSSLTKADQCCRVPNVCRSAPF